MPAFGEMFADFHAIAGATHMRQLILPTCQDLESPSGLGLVRYHNASGMLLP